MQPDEEHRLNGSSWRLFEPSDLIFAYDIAIANDPRWWRVCKRGLSPLTVVEAAQSFAAAVIISGSDGDVGIATLSETGSAGTGTLDIWTIPTASARSCVESVIVELIASAFGVSGIRALYHERFESDPYVLGVTEPFWRTAVVFPDFAMIEGRYESRTQRILRREDFETAFFHPVEDPG